MGNRYTFEDLKDEETLIKFLERVWKVGFMTGRSTDLSYTEASEMFMPDFEKELT